jgi:hypothetical protein
MKGAKGLPKPKPKPTQLEVGSLITKGATCRKNIENLIMVLVMCHASV